ncbi:MAG: methyltransferase [Oligoflexales bacterium]
MSDSKSFLPTQMSALDARFEAQKIAFGPVVFQAVRIARDKGMLRAIEQAGQRGLLPDQVATEVGTNTYTVKAVCEPAVVSGVLDMKDGAYVLTTVGHFLLNDDLTQANMDFVHDVCGEPLLHLDESLDCGRASGLKVFGSWPTVYEGLSQLPPKVKESWFKFDHIYSDSAFPDVVKIIGAHKPRRLLDIGSNTAKWAMYCARQVPEVNLTLADLPGQLAVAKQNVEKAGLSERMTYCPVDMLDPNVSLPTGFDIVWMSQFLVCFSEEEVIHILKKAAQAISSTGRIFILDTYWDRQEYDIAAYCIANTTPYFTCVANGNSRMYRYDDFLNLLKAAELEVEQVWDTLGLGHTLLKVRRVGQ